MSIETTGIRSGAASGERCGVPHVIERSGPGLAPPRTRAAVAIAQTVVEEFSAAIGGGLAPMVSAMLVARFDSIVPVGGYLAVLGVIAGTSAFLMKPTPARRAT